MIHLRALQEFYCGYQKVEIGKDAYYPEQDRTEALDLVERGIAVLVEDTKPIQKQKSVEEKVSNKMGFKTAEELFNLKPTKGFIIDQLVLPQTITMLFSPPKQFKSLIALYAAMCVANGKDFFGLKTKKCKVLYLDRENNETLIHKRLNAIRNGDLKNFKYKDFCLDFLIKSGDFDQKTWVEALIWAVEAKKVNLVIIDTLKRYSTNFDENSANDINRLYINVMQPLIDRCKCSIIFLHHTNRDGAYRGSGDFLGLVDSAYQVFKIGKDGFKLACFAARNGEVDEINGTIDIVQDEQKQLHSVSFIRKSEQEMAEESDEKWTKKREICDLIMNHFKTKGLDSYRKKDIEYAIGLAKKDEVSPETIKRAFDFLVFKRILARSGRGMYTKIGEWVSIGK